MGHVPPQGGNGVGQVMRTLQVTDSGDYSLFFLYKGRLVRSSLENDLRYFARRVNLIAMHTIIQKIICKHDLYIFFAPCGKNEVKGGTYDLVVVVVVARMVAYYLLPLPAPQPPQLPLPLTLIDTTKTKNNNRGSNNTTILPTFCCSQIS